MNKAFAIWGAGLLGAVISQPAFAADLEPPAAKSPSMTAFIEGAALYSTDEVLMDFDDISNQTKDLGWGGGGRAGILMPMGAAGFDVGVSGAYFYADTSITQGATTGVWEDEHYLVDLEIGRVLTDGPGSAMIRGAVGLRYAGFQNTFEFDNSHQQESWGLGPRAALYAEVPFAAAMSIDLYGGVSYLWGEEELSGIGPGFDNSTDKSFFNLEGSIALSHALGQAGTISIGYRAESWTDVYGDTLNAPIAGAVTSSDRLYHGPFARFSFGL